MYNKHFFLVQVVDLDFKNKFNLFCFCHLYELDIMMKNEKSKHQKYNLKQFRFQYKLKFPKNIKKYFFFLFSYLIINLINHLT